MTMTRRVLLGAIGLGSGLLAHVDRGFSFSSGRSFYVSPSGSDLNAGTVESPYRSISHVLTAIEGLGANDTVIVMPGDYLEQLVISKGGNASGYFKLKSQVPHAAKIRSPRDTYSAVNIVSSYVIFDGFDVQAGGSGHGIEATFIDGNRANNGPHHIKIINNVSHQNAGSGIGVAYGDFYTIERNVCFENCATNPYQGSGISIYSARAVPGSNEPFRNVVRGNVCFDNMEIDLSGKPGSPHSDGNGIIIDDFANSQTGYPAGIYPFRTLVENNICYRNGGRGVHVFLSNNVTVLNNTSYHNNQDPLNPGTWRGELSNVGSSHTIWANNIGVADPVTNKNNTAINEGSTPYLQSKEVVWSNNLTFNGRPGQASLNLDQPNSTLTITGSSLNLLGTDPQFAAVDVKLVSDFRLRRGSPAIDSGTVRFGISAYDNAGQRRVQGSEVDIGAFEFPEDDEIR